MQKKLERPVELILRDSFHDHIDMMRQGKMDFAWFSSPAYLENRQYLRLVVMPIYQGKLFDQAYLIVPSTDTKTQSLLHLKNKIFAYVEPDSNTGYLDSIFQLRLAGIDPNQFFSKSFFTHDHLKVISAVTSGLSDGGAVSGFAWETLALSHPEITGQTRIVAKSKGYGFPPIVCRKTLTQRDFLLIQHVLRGMPDDAEGKTLLKQLNLDGFALTDEKRYHDVEILMRRAGAL